MAAAHKTPESTTGSWTDTGSMGSPASATPKSSQIAHTLNACARCRQFKRKTRCDTGIPRCGPCQRNNAHCAYYDAAKDAFIPRTYIVQLRERIRKLNLELEKVENEVEITPDAENMVRGAGLIKFKETDESRFLGPSSGIAITRFVIDMAKQNTDSKTIREVVNETTAEEIKTTFSRESQKPTSKVYPLVSSVAEPNLPSPELTYKLVDIFMSKAQYMLPTLHEPSFRRDVDAALSGSRDPCQNFQVRMVIAISMQKISTDYAGLADSYYLAALPYLDAAIKRMDLTTLQCLALLGQYSLLTPTRTAAYWVVGVAAKLCQELGLDDESTITQSSSGRPLNFLEIDMRRRLFWVITSMEYGLSHSLGRPNAFCVSHDHINVKFFEMVDDRFITPSGTVAGSGPVMKKCIAIHFFKMRLLQAEIRRTLYLKKRATPVDDRDPWFAHMLDKLDNWAANCPKNDEGSGLSEQWFQGRRNTMIVFMFRPSPQIPQPSVRAAKWCYDACAFNVKMHDQQVETGSVDLTWIFTQSVFMALNTILWSLSYPEIRQEHPRQEVIQHIALAMKVISASASRWPGVESAGRLYENLIHGCLKAYDSSASFVVHSPSISAKPPSIAISSKTPSAVQTSAIPNANAPSPADSHYNSGPGSDAPGPTVYHSSLQAPTSTEFEPQPHTPNVPTISSIHDTSQSAPTQLTPSQAPSTVYPSGFSVPQAPYNVQPPYQYAGPNTTSTATPTPNTAQGGMRFDPNSAFNQFPSVVPGLENWDPNYSAATTTASHLTCPNAAVDPMFHVGSIGDEYSQFFQQPYTNNMWKDRSLSQAELSELMETLAHNLPETATAADEPAAFTGVGMF